MPSRDESRLVRRLRILLAVATVAAVVCGVALTATLWVRSPGQRAAEQAPPSPSVVTAPVARKVLSATVALRAEVVAAVEVKVAAVAAADASQQRKVVTALPVGVGDQVAPGALVAAVSGRPVILLPGTVAAYRDLRPQVSGDDVTQVQRALVDLGHLSADQVTGRFDRATERAVTALYAKVSAVPLTTADLDTTERQRLADLETQVRTATRTLEDAEAALAAVPSGEPVAAARRARDRARQDLAGVRAELATAQAASGVVLPAAEVVVAPPPVVVASVAAAVGTDLTGAADPAVLALAAGTLAVRAAVPPGSQEGIQAGQSATVVDDASGRSFPGTVTSLGRLQTTGEGAAATRAYPLAVAAAEPLPAELLGRSVQLRVELARTPEPVLVVPLAAVRTAASGERTVLVVTSAGESTVPVRTGLVAGGEVEVTPLEAGRLTPDDRVRLG